METETQEKSMLEIFTHMVELAIDEKGIFPHQCIHQAKPKPGETKPQMVISALACSAEEAAAHVWNSINEGASELIFGLDMFTKPGQGTEFKDVLVVAHFTKVEGKRTTNRDCWRIGVINYQPEPRIVREIDWDNAFWKENHWRYLCRFKPMFTIQKDGDV